MKTLSIFIAAIFLIMLQSCQKEISIENGIPAAPNAIDSNYLSKILYSAVVNGVPTDTAVFWTYKYDNLKRVTSFVDSTSNPVPNSYFYFYNGTDTLPFKTVLYQVGVWHDYDTTITFHYFDNTGRNAKDSVIFSYSDIFSGYESWYEIRNYSYNLNKIYGLREIYRPGGYTPYYKDTATLDAAGNIIDNKSPVPNIINPVGVASYNKMGIPAPIKKANAMDVASPKKRLSQIVFLFKGWLTSSSKNSELLYT